MTCPNHDKIVATSLLRFETILELATKLTIPLDMLPLTLIK